VTYDLTEEEALIRKTVRDFAARELAPLVAEAERSGRLPRERILPRMAELGLLSIGVPAELGGAGGSTLAMCIVAEEIARVAGGFAIGVMASVIAPSALVRLSGGRTPAGMLAPLLSGAILPAMAFTEPGGGSDLSAIRTKVTRTERGLVLDGEKTFISNGPTADVYLVAAVRAEVVSAAREERMNGLGVYVVTRGLEGFTPGPPIAKLGMRSSETGALHFENVLVPEIPGFSPSRPSAGPKEPGGFRAMMDLLDVNRLYIAALSIGLAQAAFEASLAYVKQRVAFGKPIGQHQATGFKVARMAMKLDASRALLQRACELYDAGRRCAREVSEAKLLATESAVEITGDAVQIHGAYGYADELPVERYFRDAKVGTIWEGTSEIQQQIICRELGMYASA
jgi:alkylation response protein AidB-like acyl-CoA dehydrogenase